MNYPTVTERQVPMEPVVHDDFIDSLSAAAAPPEPAPAPARPRRRVVRRRTRIERSERQSRVHLT